MICVVENVGVDNFCRAKEESNYEFEVWRGINALCLIGLWVLRMVRSPHDDMESFAAIDIILGIAATSRMHRHALAPLERNANTEDIKALSKITL